MVRELSSSWGWEQSVKGRTVCSRSGRDALTRPRTMFRQRPEHLPWPGELWAGDGLSPSD